MTDPNPPQYLKPVNKAMAAMHRVGILTGPVMILSVPGRKTGQPRNAPITPFTFDGHLYGVGQYPRADWVLNARAARVGTLKKGRKTQHIRIVELTAQQARPVLRAYPGQVPVGVTFAKHNGMVATGTPDEFEALAGHIAVFRFDAVDS